MSADATALTVTLLLAVTCFSAGIHFDYSFYSISGFLAFTVILGREVESYIWFTFVVLLIAIASICVLDFPGSQ